MQHFHGSFFAVSYNSLVRFQYFLFIIKAKLHIRYLLILLWLLFSIFSLNCLDAAHIIEYIEGEVVDKHIILKLWQESLGESYLIFQEEFDPKTVLLNHGRKLFDLPTLYVSWMYEMFVCKLSLQQYINLNCALFTSNKIVVVG